MKAKIIRDVTFDALVVVSIFEGMWFALKYLAETYLSNVEINSFFNQYYLLISIGMALVAIGFYGVCGLLCVKKYNAVKERHGIGDSELYAYYKDAAKCCQYRVNSGFIFVNTTHGIICMDRSDIIDRKCRRVHHTKTVHRTVHGNTRYRERVRDYYTYHFELKTRYGTFKTTVGNDEVLEELANMF
jgi:hypothetical protein